jgi:WD40 repeat protein
MTVKAKDVNIEDLMEAIHQKAGIKITLNPSLRGTKVTTALEKVSIEEGLKAILRSAGITSNALVFTKKNNQFSVDEILLAHGGETKAVKTDQSIKFLNKKGEVISEFPLLKEGEGSWSEVEESDNGKYIAVNNIYESNLNGENSVEKADAIILDSEGREVWRIKEHYYNGIVPSPNGKYVLAGISLGTFSIYLINKDGLNKEIKSEYDVSTPVFSSDGSFFAMNTTTIDHNMEKTQNILDNHHGNLLLLDENGNELWKRGEMFSGEDSSFSIAIIDDIVVEVETFTGKIFRFDKNGNQLKGELTYEIFAA